MRVAAIYDIHGNLPALEAVLDAIHAEGVDQVVAGGDIVPGPMPRESVSALLDCPIPGLGDVLFCHATPRDDNEIFTRLTPERRLRSVFEATSATAVICGHTHMQFDRSVGDLRVVNAGSVGMPFGEPGAYWVLLGPGIELRHTPYDRVDATERIRATAYPQAAEFEVLQPPPEAKTLEMFEAAALQ